MTQVSADEIRAVIIKIAATQRPARATDAALTQTTVLEAVAAKLGLRPGWDESMDQAVLTQWHDLFRTGYFACG